MKIEKIRIIKEFFSNCDSHVIAVDENHKMVWANHKAFAKNVNLSEINDIIVRNQEKAYCNDMIIPFKVLNENYTISVTSVYEKKVRCGFVLRFISSNDLLESTINKNVSAHQLDYFSDIRLQLSGLISTITLLAARLEEKEMYDEFKLLNNQINHCYRILSLILNPSEVAKYAYAIHNYVCLNASEFLKDICDYMSNIIRYEAVHFEYHYDKDVFIDVDADRFLMVILNIVQNSIKNNISEEVKISISLKKANGSAYLSITDNGMGISNSEMEDIFSNSNYNILQRADDKKESKAGGYGFRIIKMFCDTFNANYNILTKENEGSTILLRIPLAQDNKYPQYMKAKTSDYLTNRFSNIYVAMSKIATINFL